MVPKVLQVLLLLTKTLCSHHFLTGIRLRSVHLY